MNDQQASALLNPALTSLKADIERQLSGIKALVQSLNDAIDSAKVLSAYCAKLPQIDAEEAITDIDTILVETCDSPLLAVTAIKKSFSDFYVHEGKKSKLVFRLPGILQLHTDAADKILPICKDINDKKKVFGDLCKSDLLADRNLKELFFRECFPFLVKPQVTRQIRTIYDPQVSLVNFHWADKPNSSKITKEEVTQRINDFESSLCRTSELSSRAQQKQVAMDMLKARMAALPDSAQLRIRRPIRTQPAVTIISDKRSNFTAPIPFILFSDREPLKRTDLGNYTTKSTSTLHQGYQCLSSHMNLFLKLK